MRRKPISIPPEPRRPIPPDLVRAERAALQVILAYGLGLLLLTSLSVLVFLAGKAWLPWSLGACFLIFVAVTVAPLIHLSRKAS
ncbi:hypothetical protein [Maricaulis salignorans]|uniref:Uncharacterized protein n=1 Tax=Maricaulis salignorans TaxID=144026 RepID=A0A1G9MYC3_9PROT|nr:hypothetical protein [Maricaulis salignorans]SDL79011.1 hypothetical protein SAMN04488568_102145 [Maricaulis salignorans]